MNKPKKKKNQRKPSQRRRRPINKAVQEDTAGGVIFRHGTDGIDILMIEDARGRWTIPKGHVEEGEHHEETAKREILEETGLRHLKVLDRLGKTDFRFRRHDELVMMTTHVFLIHATEDTDNIIPEENEGIKSVQWFSAAKALDLVEYEGVGKLLLLGLKKIRQNGY